MQDSGSIHTFAKRSIVLEPEVIAGIVVIVVGFNLIIAVSWCILRNRKNVRKLHKRNISAPLDFEKYEHSIAFAVSTGAAVPFTELPKRSSERRSYYDLIHSLKHQPQVSRQQDQSPRSPQGASRSSAKTDGARLPQFVLRPQDMKELSGVPKYPKTKTGHAHRLSGDMQQIAFPTKGDCRRAVSPSAETASVYSSASAPMDYHDHLFRRQSLMVDPATPPPASAPAWLSEMPRRPTPAIVTDTVALEFEVPFPSPTATMISEDSDVATVVPHNDRRQPNSPSSTDLSPISVPSVSTPSLRTRAQSTPSTGPPQIHWITSNNSFAPPKSRRPNSVSSLSTIFSVPEPERTPTTPTIPLNPNPYRRSPEWGSVDMTRGPALPFDLWSPSHFTATQASVSVVSLGPPPALPRRSSKRLASAASAEQLR